ncbi:MAG: polysaccharide deacetylase family protein [Thermoleophilaceae bacterium]
MRERSHATAVTGLVVGVVALLVLAVGNEHDGAPAHASTSDPLLTRPLLSFSYSADRVRRESRAVDRVLRYTPYIAVGSPRHREVALTFDDGPGPFTRRIVEVLRHEHVKATFFVVGRWVATYPDLVALEHRAGFAVGDHTQSHAFLSLLNPGQQRAEILGDAHAIATAGAPWPRLFRPPYGSFDKATLKLLHRERMLMTLWTEDTRDYTRPGARAIVRNALGVARPGSILLFHDGGGDRNQTVAALPKIIRTLKRRHLHLVSVPRLILDDPPPRTQPQPRSLSGG